MYFCWNLYDFIVHYSLNGFLSLNQHLNWFFNNPLYLHHFFDRNLNVDLCRSLNKFNDSFYVLLFDNDFRGDLDYLYSDLFFLLLQYGLRCFLGVPDGLLEISHHKGLLFDWHSYNS
jgi:hypothetical protein